MTVNQLAEDLGLSIKTIHGRLKRNGVDPLSRGAKGVCHYSAKAARTACRAVHHKRRSPAKTPEEKDLQERKLLRECEKLEFELAVKQGDYLLVSVAVEFVYAAMSVFRDGLLKIPAELSDRLDPPLKAELSRLIRSRINECATQLDEIDSAK